MIKDVDISDHVFPCNIHDFPQLPHRFVAGAAACLICLLNSKIKNTLVGFSGLWINEKFSHSVSNLRCRWAFECVSVLVENGGLLLWLQQLVLMVWFLRIGKLEGILEVKCSKVLRPRSVTDIVNKECHAGELIRHGKLVLKRSHTYYYQIQLQLLITETLMLKEFQIWTFNKKLLKGLACFGKKCLFLNIFWFVSQETFYLLLSRNNDYFITFFNAYNEIIFIITYT